MSNDGDILKLNPAYTACRYCVFARYENDKQVGCDLDKLSLYEQAGIEINTVYDAEKEFKIVNGRFCLFYRNEEVMKGVPKSLYKETVTNQVSIPYHAIIFVEENTTLNDIKNTIKKLLGMKKPRMITVVNKQYPFYAEDPNKYIKPTQILSLLEDLVNIRYSLRNIYDKDMSDRDIIDLVYDGTKQLNIHSYITFRAGFDIPQNFIESFEECIFTKMQTVCFVKPYDDLNGMIVATIAHRKHAGNSFGINLESKIKEFEDNPEKLIFNISDICPLQ